MLTAALPFLVDDGDARCPFCDEPWPPEPSFKLLTLRDAAMRHAATPRARCPPRLANPSVLAADSFHILKLCAHHRAETIIIPEGREEGWPNCIDFETLPMRVSHIRPRLEAIINDPADSPFYQDTVNDLALHGALYGAQHVPSVMGQYQRFDKSRPG